MKYMLDLTTLHKILLEPIIILNVLTLWAFY